MKTAKMMMIAVFALLCGGAVYAGNLENDRAASGVRFGESAALSASPDVRISGDFSPAQKAAFTADITEKADHGTAVPPLRENKPAKEGRLGKGANAGVTIGVIAGALGASILTWGLAAAVGGPLGIAVVAIIKISIAMIAGCALGGFIGKGIGGLFDRKKQK